MKSAPKRSFTATNMDMTRGIEMAGDYIENSESARSNMSMHSGGEDVGALRMPLVPHGPDCKDGVRYLYS